MISPHRVVMLVFVIAATLAVSTNAYAQVDSPSTLGVTTPPEDVVKRFNLDPFCKKYVSGDGFPVISSEKVSDYALLEAAYLIDKMLTDRGDIRDAMITNKARFVVMAHDELTTQIPEFSDLKPAKYWDKRARGAGLGPTVSCGEENLLRYPGDPYITESTLVHEFAHAMHLLGLEDIDLEFNRGLQAAYDHAMKNGLWKGTYAARNTFDYWAEGVQSWFDTNRENDPFHNHVNTREELKEYDSQLAKLIDETFRTGDWRFIKPEDRRDKAHLAGYDSAKAPKFKWPVDLVWPAAQIILIHLVVFQGMFFAKSITLRRRLGVPICGRNRQVVLAVGFVALYVVGSFVLALLDGPTLALPVTPIGTVSVLTRSAAMATALPLLAASVLIGAASVVGLGDSWRVGILEDQRTELIEGGIYRFSRNPYFLSYLIMFAGYAVLLQNVILLILWLVGFALVHAMALREEKHLTALHGDRYREYKKRVPRHFIF